MDSNKETLLRAIGASYNLLNSAPLISHLATNTEWHSQDVFEVMKGAASILEYLNGKFAVLSDYAVSEQPLLALAELPSGNAHAGPCIAAFQVVDGEPQDPVPVALILIEHTDGILDKINMCSIAPHPTQALVMKDFPGLSVQEGTQRLHALFPGHDRAE